MISLAGKRVDCSQSPYFFRGIVETDPIRFDGAVAILICKSERDLERVAELPRGAEWGLPLPLVFKRTWVLVLIFSSRSRSLWSMDAWRWIYYLMDTRTVRGSLQYISVPSRPGKGRGGGGGVGIPVIVPFTSCSVSCDGLASHPGEVVILQFTSCWVSCDGLLE